VDTGFIEHAGDTLMPPDTPSDDLLSDASRDYGRQALAGFRLNAQPRQDVVLTVNGKVMTAHMPIHDYVEQEPLAGPAHAPAEAFWTKEGQTWRIGPLRVSGAATGAASDGAILSPMPGRIIAVAVAQGDSVSKGHKLLTLEAMKMEHSLVAPFDGVVAELNAAEGGQVSEGALLAKIEKAG
jgi:3-methylcrotonyl-CoA carboxylase alpha subunit